MAEARAGLPEGRYGRDRSADARTDRRLTVIGLVLLALLVGFVGWAGWSYIAGRSVSGELTGFEVVSDERIDVDLAIRKPSETDGVCTVRAQAEDGEEVGRADFRFDEDTDSAHRTVTLRTKSRATAAELLSCTEADTAG
ncbi:DUF4307 domain-containing protein [Streptomyces avicenniae]|uniref:DUF4307 domain-containing protein n=1 Tax=Streptomyces avicenniae TaxID=500153 RepID=UPI00069ABE61|nr:DUF4307 domain-containing protein [Streptomyces avicenniae]